MDKVRFGIVGFGNMGTGHAKNLLAGKIENGVLTAICDINPKKFELLDEKYRDQVKTFTDAKEMFLSGEVDVVMICTPHYSHPELAILAMDCSLHCIVEKPAGVYTLQVKEMLERNKTNDKILGIMFNQRTSPCFMKMRQLIKDGVIGEIKRTNWIITNWYRTQLYYDSGSWRATWAGEGGGVLYNQAPHNLDLFQWITGMMPSKVRAFCHFGKWHDIEVEDDVTAYVEYENGATGVFVTTTGDCPGTNRFEVTLEKGKIIAENGKLLLWRSDISEPEFSATNTSPFGSMKFEKSEVETDGEAPQHVGVVNAFAANILHGTPLVADGLEGINGLTISNAMHLSAFTGKTIDLENFDHELFYEELMKRVAVSRRKTNITENIAGDMSNTF